MKKRNIKKIIFIFAMMSVLLTFASCGKTLEMSMEETTSIRNQVEITPKNVLVSDRVFPPVWSSKPMGWVVNDQDKTYLTFVAEIKNLGDKDLTINDLWQAYTLHMKKESLDCDIVAMVTEDGTCLDDGERISPKKTETLYFIHEIAIADCKEEMEAVFDLGSGPKARVTFNGGKTVAEYETLPMHSQILVDGMGTVEVEKISFVDKVDPDNPGYIYDYYAPKSKDEKLLLVEASVVNTEKKKQSAAAFFNVLAFVDGDEYYGDLLLEDGTTVKTVADETIEEKDSTKIDGIMSIPNTLTLKDLELYIYIDGTYYRYDG